MLHHPAFQQKRFKEAISDVTQKAELELLNDPNVNTEMSGSTMCLVIVCSNQIIVANIGDSRVILGKNGISLDAVVEPLTVDHKPSHPSEKNRIVSSGGRVFPVVYPDGVVGPDRVWLADQRSPGLAMSRSVCDEIAHRAGVISAPDFFERIIQIPQDLVLILATDGLWDVVSNRDAVQLCLRKHDTSVAVSNLIKEARQRWRCRSSCMDDVTVCVAFFHTSSP